MWQPRLHDNSRGAFSGLAKTLKEHLSGSYLICNDGEQVFQKNLPLESLVCCCICVYRQILGFLQLQ